MRGYFQSAGAHVSGHCRLAWVSRLIREASPDAFGSAAAAAQTCHLRVEAERTAFGIDGFEPLTRGAWCRKGTAVMENGCTSGFDLLYRREEGLATFTFRWRPPLRDRLASAVALSRAVLLARAAVMQSPVLWLAGTRGRALLHAAVCTAG